MSTQIISSQRPARDASQEVGGYEGEADAGGNFPRHNGACEKARICNLTWRFEKSEREESAADLNADLLRLSLDMREAL